MKFWPIGNISRWVFLFSAAAFVCILDRLIKLIVIENLSCGQSIRILPNIFHLTLVLNTGTAFGLFKNNNAFFISASFIIIIFLVIYIWKYKPVKPVLLLSTGLILGGAIGNLIDRVKFGYIIDFLDFRIWPVFNIADSAISIGVILLIWQILFKPKS